MAPSAADFGADSVISRGSRRQAIAFGAIAIGAVAGAATLQLVGDSSFRPYLGSLSPILATTLLGLMGGIALRYSHLRANLRVYEASTGLRALLFCSALATLLAAAMIIVDLIAEFPADMNVPLPMALLFYPTAAFVVEIVFHVLPMSLLVLLIGRRFGTTAFVTPFWLCALLVASFEPIFQVVAGFSRDIPQWASGAIGVHLLVFNLLQIYAFKRFGFASMLLFRLIYYLHWHIIWGHLRLGALC